jgi:hypothetical protein
MADGSNPASGDHTRPDPRSDDRPDLGWARRQRLLALVGNLLALIGLAAAVGGLVALPPGSGADGYAVTAVLAAAVLVGCCGVLGWCWTAQLADWRSGTDGRYPGRARLSLAAHLASYVAVLVAMYATLAASALAGWADSSGTLFGVSFLVVIFGQIIGGTQLLRRSGPPGTIPTYLRRLNAKVQSLR